MLDRALEAFWKRGYGATSIPELEVATGLGRGSLYNAFGDKEGLFLEVLERYRERYRVRALAQIDPDDAGESIRLMLLAITERMSRGDVPAGCLLANSIVECAGTEGRVRSAVIANAVELEHCFEAIIKRAARTRQIPVDTDAEPLARYFAAIVQSLALAHKASPDVTRLRDIVDVAMRVWPRKPEPKRRPAPRMKVIKG